MIDVLTQNVQSEPEVDLGVGVHLGTEKGVPIKVYTVSSKFQALSFLAVLFRQLALPGQLTYCQSSLLLLTNITRTFQTKTVLGHREVVFQLCWFILKHCSF